MNQFSPKLVNFQLSKHGEQRRHWAGLAQITVVMSSMLVLSKCLRGGKSLLLSYTTFCLCFFSLFKCNSPFSLIHL